MQLPREAVPGHTTIASARKLRSVSFSGPIPDTLWPEALARVQQIANRVGVFELVVRVDEPGHQDVQLVAPDKAHFELGSRQAATIFAKPDATSKRRTSSSLALESTPIWPCRETGRRHLLRHFS